MPCERHGIIITQRPTRCLKFYPFSQISIQTELGVGRHPNSWVIMSSMISLDDLCVAMALFMGGFSPHCSTSFISPLYINQLFLFFKKVLTHTHTHMLSLTHTRTIPNPHDRFQFHEGFSFELLSCGNVRAVPTSIENGGVGGGIHHVDILLGWGGAQSFFGMRIAKGI